MLQYRNLWQIIVKKRLFKLSLGIIFMKFMSSADFFLKINFFEKFFQEYHQGVKQFVFRSGPTFCRAWSGSKGFAKVISRRQKSPLAGKELIEHNVGKQWRAFCCYCNGLELLTPNIHSSPTPQKKEKKRMEEYMGYHMTSRLGVK